MTGNRQVNPRIKIWSQRLFWHVHFWWCGGVGIDSPVSVYTSTHGRQAVWQLCRLPLSLLIFLYAVCSIIAGRLVTLFVFHRFLTHIFIRLSEGSF